ncbi:DNA-processing protein DprA [Microbacterium sp. SL62]|uniref:DNA-processing protein DprA n=1 Tax=Microbacterium sp. SL62 TaxID=2995139 RepID=UPI0022741DF4|nr:DNA-processing protein DprA [Microbacterium sp. SL62]MCY1718573.1 DNA-processing protein DprA [Microbacterium sp. SL62]
MGEKLLDELRAAPGVLETLQKIRPGDDHDEALARIAWSVIAEPDDECIGAAITGLGAAGALRDIRPLEGAGEAKRRSHIRAASAAITDACALGARLVIPGDEHWPAGLGDLGDRAPFLLWVRGDIRLLSAPSRVAIIGARAATAAAESLARQMAEDLARSGVVVVGTLGWGIGGAAHRGALAVGGPTVAVAATGLDKSHPLGHKDLADEIASAGALISELPFGATATKWRYLARQRVIAAMTEATVVVEAGWRSDNIRAAEHALSIGRVVAAVPGSWQSAASAGTFRLLKDFAARPVNSAEHVRELLPSLNTTDAPAS